jgi:hypothetical protein
MIKPGIAPDRALCNVAPGPAALVIWPNRLPWQVKRQRRGCAIAVPRTLARTDRGRSAGRIHATARQLRTLSVRLTHGARARR